MVPQSRDYRSLLHRIIRKIPPGSWPPVQYLPGRIASGLFTTLSADPPDVGQFAQVLPERLLMIGGKCSCVRAKAAHMSGHLPAAPVLAVLWVQAQEFFSQLAPDQLFSLDDICNLTI